MGGTNQLSAEYSILLVDDNHEFTATMADIINGFGWHTHCCSSPEEAFGYLEQHSKKTSLLLLDIEFTTSHLDGLDALAITVKKYPSLPVIMISGKGTIENAVRATKLGAVNFIE